MSAASGVHLPFLWGQELRTSKACSSLLPSSPGFFVGFWNGISSLSLSLLFFIFVTGGEQPLRIFWVNMPHVCVMLQ